MVNNETIWESAIEIRNAINKLTYILELQNEILQHLLEVLNAKQTQKDE
jgi:hypothetical protein